MSTVLAAAARVDEPLARVLAFSRRFGPETTALAMHAALPLGLSPELVHLLRVNFVPRAPFIAEADLLLSPLCTEAGGGMYEMDTDVRELLLAEMARTPRYGPAQQRRVAGFLRLWAARALDETADADLQEHLRVQQWVALAYADPARAAEELAGALRAGVERADRPEVARVARLTTVLSAPLAAEVELRRYAGAVERMAATGAAAASGAGGLSIGRERLPSLDRVIGLWNPAPAQDVQQPSNVSDGEPIQQQVESDGTASTGDLHGYRVARVLVLGDEGVGKTSLINRISSGGFELLPSTDDGLHAVHWAVSTRESGAKEVVFHQPVGPLAMQVAESAAVMVLVDPENPSQAARWWLSAIAATAVPRPTLLVIARIDTGKFTRSDIQVVAKEFDAAGVHTVSALTGRGINRLQTGIEQIIPWDRVPAAASREEVDALEDRVDDLFGSVYVADYGGDTRRELAAGMRAADPEAALARAMQLLVVRDVVRIIGEPPTAMVRALAYSRCLGEIWRTFGSGTSLNGVNVPAVTLRLLQEHFATTGLTEYLGAGSVPGVLDLVLEDLLRHRWAYRLDLQGIGPTIVIPSMLRPQETRPGTPRPEGRPLIQARWAGGVDDIFVVLLVHLSEYFPEVGAIDLRPPRAAFILSGTGVFQLHAALDGGRAQITLSVVHGGEDADGLSHMIHDWVARYLPDGIRAEFVYGESVAPSGPPLEPPAGVDLERACLVVLPLGTKQVGERVIDFDVVWEHLFQPAIASTLLPQGWSLVPVRISELPPLGSPLPDWMKAAQMVLVDLTGVDAGRVEELGLMPGHRTQHVVLFQEIYDPPRSSADDQVNGYAYGGPEELAGQRELLSQRLAEVLGVPGGGTGAGGEMLVTTAVQLNVRQGPGGDQPVVAQLHRGTPVERLQEADGWIRIQAPTGITGWISAQFAAPEQPPAAQEAAPVRGRVRVTASVLNVRTGPGTDHPRVGQGAAGMVLDRLEDSADGRWLRVRLPEGLEGWVASRYVTDLPAPQPVLTAAVAPTVVRPGEDVKVGVVFFTQETRDEASKYLESRPWAQQTAWGPALGGHKSGVTIHARMTMPWLSNTGLFNRLSWDGTLASMEFAVRVPADAYETRGSLRLDFGVSPAPDDSVNFAEAMAFKVEVVAADNARTPEPQPAPTAFACFARADRVEVLKHVASLRSAGGMDVFVGVDSLEAGAEWPARIDQEICSRDVFLLFWSRTTAASKSVEVEWRKALECFGASGKPEIQIHVLEAEAAEFLPMELRQFATIPGPDKPLALISGSSPDVEKYGFGVMDACVQVGMQTRRIDEMASLPIDHLREWIFLVKEADVYVGIFGQRYGDVPWRADISLAQMEYERAVELDIPRVIFMPYEDAPVSRDEIDVGERGEKLRRLRERLKDERFVAYFKDQEDLRAQAVRKLSEVRGLIASRETARAASADRPRRKGDDLA